MDFNTNLQKHSKMPLERFRVVCEVEKLGTAGIRRGIIFVMAVWSGPAVVAFKRFTQVLSEIDTTGLDLVLLDIDCLDPETSLLLKAQSLGGGGETYWVRNGEIVASVLACSPGCETEIVKLTSSLVDEQPT